MSIVTSANGGVRVRANDQGTPLHIEIENGELRRAPDALARMIVGLCRQASITAGLRRRAELERAGVSAEVLRALRLPEPGDQQSAGEPGIATADSWLRRV